MHLETVDSMGFCEGLVYLFFNKCLSARAAAKQLCIHPRTAQRWVKRYFEDPESIFEIKKKTGRPRILGDDHEQFVVNFIDKRFLRV